MADLDLTRATTSADARHLPASPSKTWEQFLN
jgi:hypothetical protein